jgi:aquaporin NIP
MKRYAAEFFGTFCLVFAGTGAMVVDSATHGQVSHVGVALTFGLVVMAMIYAVGDISGAHLNPAVTLGFYAARRFERASVLPYIFSQCAGALLASMAIRLIFPGESDLGATRPVGSAYQSFVLELVMTWLLMLVILSASRGAKEKGITAGIAIGAVIALEALLGGPVSGASMNPARSLGPAIIAGDLRDLWIYLAAPVAGALLAVPVCCLIREKGCCSRAAGGPCGQTTP